MKQVKKASRAEQLQEAKNVLWKILDQYKLDDIMQFVFDTFDNDIDEIQGDIENEIEYIKWETSAYAGERAEARKRIAALKKYKQAKIKAIKDFEKACANLKKIKDIR